jgi:hypothetical protein
MRRTSLHIRPLAFSVMVAFSIAVECAAQLQRYEITPGSPYTYLPSPEGPGIPGGVPSAYQLDFGVRGFFTVEYSGATAKLTGVDVALSGNETIQESASAFAAVTPQHVADFLESRQFVGVPDMDPNQVYVDTLIPPFPPGLVLTDFRNGSVTLVGGLDTTGADGFGRLFEWNAVAIPEPGTLPLAALALVGGSIACGLRRW